MEQCNHEEMNTCALIHLLHALQTSDELGFFQLFFTNDLLNDIVSHTRPYAVKKFAKPLLARILFGANGMK